MIVSIRHCQPPPWCCFWVDQGLIVKLTQFHLLNMNCFYLWWVCDIYSCEITYNSALWVEITITSKVFNNRGSYLGRRPYLAFREICPVMELLQMVIQMAHYPTPVHELQIHLGECFKHWWKTPHVITFRVCWPKSLCKLWKSWWNEHNCCRRGEIYFS